MKTWEAFDRIAGLLELDCLQGTGFNIRTQSPPPSLTPTLQQLIIPHKPYIDMLPWCLLRDRILRSISAINEAEFVKDMADFQVWGSTPYDPMGWEISAEFARKWWFLIDDVMIKRPTFGEAREEKRRWWLLEYQTWRFLDNRWTRPLFRTSLVCAI
jgi:hypothetical protein